ncbi:DUF956 family protein [Parafannyhessea umbonata]|uniref:DUF956 family protein n=1 Tax=Parafannyhessea umbonata TaxID=604330 RepID=A0A1G6HP22_9ACTN|nr:DUF956 family protein [Parafannyhessea umbonata]MDD6359835.1 DUF956 family protein [Parafannyhessea umbonata]MDD6600875.1 DUF956 family protein [Parafannyhessea umbonata]SDB95934.1 hypothetical protein SAMN04487824_10141 [Parafannyhessea umbonata]
MAISMNTSVEYSSKATFLQGFTTYGDVMVGDKAFEFYNEKNKEDFVQIPWEEIDYVSAEVLGKKNIVRFAIFTKEAGHFTFSTRDNRATLRAVREHVPADRLLRSPNALQVAKMGVKSIPSVIGGVFKRGK